MPHVSKLLVLTLVLGLTLAVPLYAQTQDLKFEHINVAEGLSMGNVSAMFQDQQGFLWFGTWDGLNKYDGYSFTTYNHNRLDTTSISGNHISVIRQGPDGTIWVGTARSGLNRFDPATERFTHYRHDPDDPHTLSHDGIAHIHIDQAGRLWILSRDQQAGLNVTYPTPFTRLDRLDPETGLVTRYRHDPDDPQSLGHDVVLFIPYRGLYLVV